MATDLKQPNGIVGTPDGKMLYVADIGAGKTYSYTMTPGGTLENKTLFCGLGSDGMTIDTEGNLYLTGKGVTIFDKTGKKLMNIPIPEAWTGNVKFGGKDRDLLFITASKKVYGVKMRVQRTGKLRRRVHQCLMRSLFRASPRNSLSLPAAGRRPSQRGPLPNRGTR